MSVGAIIGLFSAMIGVAALTVAVTHPGTANVIQAFGNAFSGSLKTAMGG